MTGPWLTAGDNCSSRVLSRKGQLAAAKRKTRKQRGRGEGSISRRANGRWEAKITVGYGGTGKRIRRAVYGNTKQEVQDKLAELRGQARAGTLVDPSSLKLADYLTHWLANTVKPKTSVNTHARYESLVRLKITPHIGGLKVATLVPMHVYHLMGELERLGESLWTRKMSGTVLHNALKQAVRLKLLTHNQMGDGRSAGGVLVPTGLLRHTITALAVTIRRRGRMVTEYLPC